MTSHFDKMFLLVEYNKQIILLESALQDIKDKECNKYKKTLELVTFIKSFRDEYNKLFEENIYLLKKLIEHEKDEATEGVKQITETHVKIEKQKP